MIYRNWRWLIRSLALLLSALPVAVWGQASPNPKLVEAAKKEGELVYYTTMTLTMVSGFDNLLIGAVLY